MQSPFTLVFIFDVYQLFCGHIIEYICDVYVFQ